MSAAPSSNRLPISRQNRTEARRLGLQIPPPEDYWSLHNWVFGVLGYWIPCQQVCPGHTTPYQYFYDRYFGISTQTILWANRGGEKSWLAGLECWMKGRFNGLWDATILGGSKYQSERAYRATDDFWRITDDIDGRDVLLKEPLLSKTVFKNGSVYEILTASETTVRGPHPIATFLDEIDEIKVRIFNAAMEQPQSKGSHEASWALLSTMHRVGGLMANWVDNASAKGFTLYKHCVLETMEGCYDYECSTCPLDEHCQGKMKPAMEAAEESQIERGTIKRGQKAYMGFNTVEDTIKKVQLGITETEIAGQMMVKPVDVAAELFCQRPSKMGLVYQVFNEDVHVVDAKNLVIPDEWPRYRTFDFGYSNPFVCLYIAVSPSDVIHVYREYVEVGIEMPEHCKYLANDSTKYLVNTADPSGADERAQLRSHKIPTKVAERTSLSEGLDYVRGVLNLRPSGQPNLIISSACRFFISEFLSYRYPENRISEVPEKKNDHSMDAFRYWVSVWREGQLRPFSDLVKEIEVKEAKHYGQGTGAREYAASKAAVKKLQKGRRERSQAVSSKRR